MLLLVLATVGLWLRRWKLVLAAGLAALLGRLPMCIGDPVVLLDGEVGSDGCNGSPPAGDGVMLTRSPVVPVPLVLGPISDVVGDPDDGRKRLTVRSDPHGERRAGRRTAAPTIPRSP